MKALHNIFLEIYKELYYPEEEMTYEEMLFFPVYYEPPSSIQMSYPCIVYHYTNDRDDYADNKRYFANKQYTVTVMDPDEDSLLAERVKDIPYCSLASRYSTEGLTYWVYTLYFNGPRFIKEEEEENG